MLHCYRENVFVLLKGRGILTIHFNYYYLLVSYFNFCIKFLFTPSLEAIPTEFNR